MISDADPLGLWLAEQDATPPEGFWGVQDCWLFAADWVMRRTGRDPAAGHRGRYASAGTARHRLRAHGGWEATARDCMASVGWVPSRRARRGQVGLVWAEIATKALRRRSTLIGAVCLGGGWWAARTAEGLLLGRARAAVTWRPGR